jgi:Uma2 family endonuclease
MQTALSRDYISVDDYLAGEETSVVKHEYIDGNVYAMAGASKEHNLISLNIAAAFRSHLKGRPCRVFMAGVKAHIETAGKDTFYYPDVIVGCHSRDTHRLISRYPKVIVEVSSESTERLDRGEKLMTYQSIETLEEYVIVAQDRPDTTIFRRANKWQPEAVTGLGQRVYMKSIDLTLSLAEIYEGVLTVES